MAIITDNEVFTEVFPVNEDSLPKLYAYKLDVSGDSNTIGGKLSYRLRKKFSGHWVWTEYRVVTEAPQPEDKVNELIKQLWGEQPAVFGDLKGAKQDVGWCVSPKAQADFVVNGLFDDLHWDINSILLKHKSDRGKVSFERVFEKRGWVVQGKPAVSMSIFSHVVYHEVLSEYAKTLNDLNELKGLWVSGITGNLKGEIVEISGLAKEHRERLLALTQDQSLKELYAKASNDTPVVKVSVGNKGYDYIANSLRLILRSSDYRKFGLDSSSVLKWFRMEPKIRYSIINEVFKLAAEKKLILPSYDSVRYPEAFMTSKDVGFEPLLRFGGNKIESADKMWYNLRDYGLYKPSKVFENRPISIAVLKGVSIELTAPFFQMLLADLKKVGFEAEYVSDEKITSFSRDEIERKIINLEKFNPDIILAVFPDEYDEDDEGSGTYYHFKSLTVGQGMPSQIVNQSTISNKWATSNIIMGILGKTGNIPFVLSNPLPYADLVVGIDIARERKKKLSGSMNATGIARIYFNDGEFLKYVIHDCPLEGETIDDNILMSLFPASEFRGKRVVIHRDGYFRGGERQALKNWAEKIKAQFYLVEVIKTGAPRVYSRINGGVDMPIKGTAFKINNNEAFLISTLPPFKGATPQPLHIRTESPFSIEQAIHSILSLTLLHYGSVRQPRCPVTIHYSDRMSYLALRGIKPKNLEGTVPFWL